MKITIISADQARMETLRKMIIEGRSGRSVSLCMAGIDELGATIEQARPDVLIVDGIIESASQIGVLEAALAARPGLACVLVCSEPSSDLLMAAMRAGVRDVLPSPLDAAALEASLGRIETILGDTPLQDKPGKILAFIPCKGGSGATFLAANFAYVLATEENQRVALLDLNLNFGDASLFVSDQVPLMNLADLTGNVARLDASLLDSSMIHVTPNLSILAAPDSIERAIAIRPEQVEAIIKLAVAEYDFVILDVSRNLGPVSLRALDLADRIFPVLQLTLPFIRDAKRLIGAMKSLGYSDEKIGVIVNRLEHSDDIGIADVERTLGRKVMLTVPNSFKAVSASVNQGVPIALLDKKNPVAKSLRELARIFLPAPQVRQTRWLGQLFGMA